MDFMGWLSILSSSLNDLLLPKPPGGRATKIPLVLDIRSAIWVIKETQILPKFCL